uniref:Uncharacterized protein n=1 Tax=Palpitomonas bilix TaxID=652834 RepID=A0A7S3D8D2_9EUKA|mmetsp:Transcript_2449/g.5094  ORF Transcript_2449/g.5094 Transcript_2449/m.5094 type:complete len:126 (+) Transcript_2449:164-541(+)
MKELQKSGADKERAMLCEIANLRHEVDKTTEKARHASSKLALVQQQLATKLQEISTIKSVTNELREQVKHERDNYGALKEQMELREKAEEHNLKSFKQESNKLELRINILSEELRCAKELLRKKR